MKIEKIQFKKASELSVLNGFTLLEVLIATAIFAVVMVMTTGVLAQTTSYQTKTKNLRDVSEEAGRISDAISRDLKMASGSFTVYDTTTGGAAFHLFKSGVALVDADGKFLSTYTTPASIPTTDSFTTYLASAVIINLESQKQIVIYESHAGAPNGVYANTYDKSWLRQYGWWTDPTATNPGVLRLVSSMPANGNILANAAFWNHQISTGTGDNILDTSIGFAGFTATDASDAIAGRRIQSYVTYFVHARTNNYDSLPPIYRGEAYLRSMITLRSYPN